MADLSAEVIGRAVGSDPQIAVPARPAVRRGVRLRRVGDAVMLDGADRPQAFSGRFARESLSLLVAACDGGRTHAELASEVGLDEAAVRKSVALLWAAGVVEEGAAEDRRIPAEFACFLSRLGNSTGANGSWVDGAARLARTTVELSGDHRLAAARAVAGVCDVVADGGALCVFFETAASRSELAAVRRRCWATGSPLLRVRLDAESLIIGPYVDPSCTPCLTCATTDEDDLAGDPPEHAFELAAGLVGHHLVALLSRATKTFLPREKSVLDLATLATSYRAGTTRPGCPACSFADGPEASAAPVAAVYEAAVALPPRRFLDPTGHLGHYQSSNLRLQTEFRDWPGGSEVPLPPPDLSRLSGAPGNRAAADLDDLGLVLKIAFGVRDISPEGRVKRWTAAAGNIGSVTAYLVSRDAAVLPVGVYAYLERDHVLARLPSEVPQGPQRVLLVVTGNLEKVARKYGPFGLRLVLLDAGCAVSSAREVAGHLGLEYSLEQDWDEASLIGGLGLSPGEEPIAAVMGLG
ncbi:hypothetical protein [Amycolatopsis minnesotensis]|uniref:SagB-type dehydrogenase family enzyme n=1 Tax=Amycolatopsis minnesotensis TaxID=337894 RepID=A0ABN2R6Z8_9PSEU